MSKMLIVVDMLNDFVHKDGVLSFDFARNIIPFLEKRVRHYVETKERMIFLCDSHDENDEEFKRFPKHAVKDTWGAKVIDDLFWLIATHQGIIFDNVDYIRKKRYSGFYGTSLAAELNIHKPDEVEVVGVCTSICVMDTVGGLANRDYKVVVPVRGVADFDNDAHKAALGRMETLYGAKIIED